MTDIVLSGCTPEPLAAYLKSLSVLRLVSEQKDIQAKGSWKDGCFHLQSSLDSDNLVRFFMKEYKPTPVVAPWNGGSGFYPGDPEAGRNAILNCSDPRFEEYRGTIRTILSWPAIKSVHVTIRAMLDQLTAAQANKEGVAQKEIAIMLDEVRTLGERMSPTPSGVSVLDLTLEELKGAGRSKGAEYARLLKNAKKLYTIYKRKVRVENKEVLVRACRNELPDSAVEWLDAAIALGDEDNLMYPPLLGTGGNEGRLDYTSGFMDLLVEVLLSGDHARNEALLRNALFATPSNDFRVASVGQFDPGRAGGYNQGSGNRGIEAKDFPINPWDYILGLEGSIAWSNAVTKRQRVGLPRTLCSPFTVRPSSVGYSSASQEDVEAGKGEIWTPLWRQPVGYPELRAFIGEGRAELGRNIPRTGLQFAEAVASLGVDRGVTQFVRYSLLRRRGDSFVAVPISRFTVVARTESDLVRQLDPLLAQFRRTYSAKKKSPARLLSASREVEEALYTTLLQGGASSIKMLVAAIGRLEQLVIVSGGFQGRPFQGLTPDWVVAADDGSVEVRIAAALASIRGTGKVGTIRANLSPVDPEAPWHWAKGRSQTCWEGASLSSRLCSVAERRLMDAERLSAPRLPFYGTIRVAPEDVAMFLGGVVDESLIEDLLFGFSWINWSKTTSVVDTVNHRWSRRVMQPMPIPRQWCLLKPLFLSGELKQQSGEKVRVWPEASIIPLLRAGRVSAACKVAYRRLSASGFKPAIGNFPDSMDGLRLAASLLIPVSLSRGWMETALGEKVAKA